MADTYLTALRADRDATIAYYRKSVVKTEQQKVLERLMRERGADRLRSIADLACGGGTLSHHLAELCPAACFTLLDYNEDALAASGSLNDNGRRFRHVRGTLYSLPWNDASFDALCVAQTLSWIDRPEKALCEMMRSLRSGGRAYVSALFNLDHDVDLYTDVVDHTRPSSELGLALSYHTYSRLTIERWLNGHASSIEFVRFDPEIDFQHDGRGIGTYTVATATRRLQFSAGLLLNWAFLIAKR